MERLGARIYPDMLSLARAHEAFDDAGQLLDPELAQFLRTTLEGFTDLVDASKHYPLVKTAWIEFLDEPHTDATARIDAPPKPSSLAGSQMSPNPRRRASSAARR